MAKHYDKQFNNAWLNHVSSNTEKCRETVKAKIKDIYNESKRNYGFPKIT